MSKFEERYKKRMEFKNAKKRELLKLAEKSTMRAQDIASQLKINSSSIYIYLRELEEMGCVKLFKAIIPNDNGIGGNPNIFVKFLTWETYKDQSVKVKGELPPLPFDETLSRMMGYTNVHPSGAKPVHNLDKPHKSPPLRKINTSWMGYQSGLELA